MHEATRIVGLGDDIQGPGLALVRGTGSLPSHPEPHRHDFHQVSLILSSPGAIRWELGGDRSEVAHPAAGDLVVCPAGVPTLVAWERPFEAISIRLATDRLDAIARQAGFEDSVTLRPRVTRRDPFLRAIAAKLAEIAGPLASPDPSRDLLVDSLATAVGTHLLRDYQATDPRPRSPERRLPASEVNRVRAFIAAHLADDLTVDRLAALVRRSPFDFIRQFGAATGRTPHQEVLAMRVAAARELILDGTPIAEAAAEVGFASQSHLHGHIRRLLGVTPGALAREGRALRQRPR